MEWDTDRAGDFEPLRFAPRDKMIVLGLVSLKFANLKPRMISNGGLTKPPNTYQSKIYVLALNADLPVWLKGTSLVKMISGANLL